MRIKLINGIKLFYGICFYTYTDLSNDLQHNSILRNKTIFQLIVNELNKTTIRPFKSNYVLNACNVPLKTVQNLKKKRILNSFNFISKIIVCWCNIIKIISVNSVLGY